MRRPLHRRRRRGLPRLRCSFITQQLRLGLAGCSHGDLPMIDPHRQVRDQRALDVANHLLRRELRSRQHMNLIYRTAVTRHDPRGDHAGQRQNQLFSTLDREYTASNRRGQ